MHSSRMRTVRCSGRLRGVAAQGGCLPKGISAQRWCLPREGICPGRVSAQGVSAQGLSAWGCLPGGVSAWGCTTPWTQRQTPPDQEADTLPRQTPPWTQRQTSPAPRCRHPHPCRDRQRPLKNITFPQLLLRAATLLKTCTGN